MARSKLDTLIYATILLAPLATAIGYIALTPEPEPVIVTIPAIAPVAPTTAPAPQTLEPPAPVVAPEPVIAEPVAAEPVIAEPVAEPVAEAPRPPEPGAALLVHDRQLLLTTAGEHAWTQGKLRAHTVDYGLAASKAVDPTRLPAELQPLVDARFIVHAADGSSCTINTGALSLYAREDGDYDWDGEEEGNPIKPDRAALFAERKAVFERAHLVFARFAGNARCNGLWARRADLPAPAVFASVALDEAATAALRTRVLAVLEAQPAVVQLHAAFDAFIAEYERESESRAEISWPELLASVRVTRWDELGGPRQLVNVEIGLGDQGCGWYFTDEAALMFALAGDALQPHADGGFLGPKAIMDLERDGHFEAVTSSGRTIETRGPATAHQAYEFPFNGCGC